MAFALGVEDASGFYKYLINVIAVTASVAWLLLLFIRSIDSKVYREFKPFSIAMSLQLLFVTVRNLTTLLLSSVSTLRAVYSMFFSDDHLFFFIFAAPPALSFFPAGVVFWWWCSADKKKSSSASLSPDALACSYHTAIFYYFSYYCDLKQKSSRVWSSFLLEDGKVKKRKGLVNDSAESFTFSFWKLWVKVREERGD